LILDSPQAARTRDVAFVHDSAVATAAACGDLERACELAIADVGEVLAGDARREGRADYQHVIESWDVVIREDPDCWNTIEISARMFSPHSRQGGEQLQAAVQHRPLLHERHVLLSSGGIH